MEIDKGKKEDHNKKKIAKLLFFAKWSPEAQCENHKTPKRLFIS